jgi:diaminohydroxyphosphoribosylaminopyrimidine deaminase/5-amino-6-(5-phosphoribosylamino)uracil reductase
MYYKNNSHISSDEISLLFDRLMMQRCIELAKKHQRNVFKNPTVGAAVVYENRIIGEGAHELYGEGHAEVNAIQNIKEKEEHLLKKSTIYVTLEPCFHHGKTPPCVALILEKKIPRVVISCIDPYEKVSGKSIELLQANGVEVVVGVLEKEGLDLIRPFKINTFQQRPYVILKYAQSADGFIGKENEQVWLTNSFSKHLVHKWRSECDGILVGTKTVLVDNPALTNRLYFGKNPTRVVIDKQLKISSEKAIFDDVARTIFLNEKKEKKETLHHYMKVDFNEKVICIVLKRLFEEGISKLIVEGGATTIQNFVNTGLWDEARVFYASKMIFDGIKSPELSNARLVEESNIQNDKLKVFYNLII